MVWMVSIIGMFVLVLACINFMNLSTARSEKRAREVGIRKAIGSMRKQIIYQFFGEIFSGSDHLIPLRMPCGHFYASPGSTTFQ